MGVAREGKTYNAFLPAAFTFAHLALAATAILALAAALNVRLTLRMGDLTSAFCPFVLAQRALAAADILARTAALRRDFFLGTLPLVELAELAGEPKSRPSAFSRNSILSFICAARRNSRAERSVINELMSFELDISHGKVNHQLFAGDTRLVIPNHQKGL